MEIFWILSFFWCKTKYIFKEQFFSNFEPENFKCSWFELYTRIFSLLPTRFYMIHTRMFANEFSFNTSHMSYTSLITVPRVLLELAFQKSYSAKLYNSTLVSLLLQNYILQFIAFACNAKSFTFVIIFFSFFFSTSNLNGLKKVPSWTFYIC